MALHDILDFQLTLSVPDAVICRDMTKCDVVKDILESPVCGVVTPVWGLEDPCVFLHPFSLHKDALACSRQDFRVSQPWPCQLAYHQMSCDLTERKPSSPVLEV